MAPITNNMPLSISVVLP